MIVLTLLHPTKSIPLQHWTFEDESVIRIGRGMDNSVVLYSAVVSRHHLDLRKNGSVWELESFGANGTFLDTKQITQPLIVEDGMIIRLASSGPQIKIQIKAQGIPSQCSSDITESSGSMPEENIVNREQQSEKETIVT